MGGCRRKMRRFFAPESQRALVLALDHGVSSGMLQGMDDVPGLVNTANSEAAGAVQGVVLNKGLVRAWPELVPHTQNLLVQLSGGTRHGLPTYNKSIICSVSEALRLGADAVAVHLNIGNELEDRMLSDCGMVIDDAHQAGLPVLAVIYARGGQIVNELDPSLIAHCVRLGGELGADIVSVLYSGDMSSFGAAVAACPVPVLVAGGPPQPDLQSFLAMVESALECGAKGVLAGRNIFQRHAPAEALKALAELVHREHNAEKGPAADTGNEE